MINVFSQLIIRKSISTTANKVKHVPTLLVWAIVARTMNITSVVHAFQNVLMRIKPVKITHAGRNIQHAWIIVILFAVVKKATLARVENVLTNVRQI
jgi:hypothetical protein